MSDEEKVMDLVELVNAPTIISFRQALKTFKPTTKAETIAFIHFLSDIAAAEKEIKPKLYAFLDNKCGDCEEHEVDGLRVIKISPETKEYNSTPEIEAAELAITEAKEALQAAKDTAGFELKPGKSYWKAVR